MVSDAHKHIIPVGGAAVWQQSAVVANTTLSVVVKIVTLMLATVKGMSLGSTCGSSCCHELHLKHLCSHL